MGLMSERDVLICSMGFECGFSGICLKDLIGTWWLMVNH